MKYLVKKSYWFMRCPLLDRTNIGQSGECVKLMEWWPVSLIGKSLGLESSSYMYGSMAIWREGGKEVNATDTKESW